MRLLKLAAKGMANTERMARLGKGYNEEGEQSRCTTLCNHGYKCAKTHLKKTRGQEVAW